MVKTIRKKPRKNKKFRFQLLHHWLIKNYNPCKVADVGGGKGLLSYLLAKSGWDTTIIDPFNQVLPHKYKDFEENKRIKLSPQEITSQKRLDKNFSKDMGQDFDLLIGLHAHGSNMLIIDSCAEYQKNFVLLPCCVIDEPIEKKPGINWIESLIEYATKKGFDVKTEKLGFKGQDMIIYSNMQEISK